MPFQLLDLILVAIMLVSGLLALMRGFTREVLSLVAWGCAAAAAFFAIHSQGLLDLANQYIKPEIAAKIAVAGGVATLTAGSGPMRRDLALQPIAPDMALVERADGPWKQRALLHFADGGVRLIVNRSRVLRYGKV